MSSKSHTSISIIKVRCLMCCAVMLAYRSKLHHYRKWEKNLTGTMSWDTGSNIFWVLKTVRKSRQQDYWAKMKLTTGQLIIMCQLAHLADNIICTRLRLRHLYHVTRMASIECLLFHTQLLWTALWTWTHFWFSNVQDLYGLVQKHTPHSWLHNQQSLSLKYLLFSAIFHPCPNLFVPI